MPAHTIVEPSKPAPIPDRVKRYEGNLDKALALIPPSERLSELTEERERWIARYERFVERLDRGEAPHWGEHVNDYILVIALLGERIAQERRR